MHKKFEIKRTKIKGGCQSGRKVVTHNSYSDLPLVQVKAVPLFFPTDRHPQSLFDLQQNHMSTSHNIRAHAQEV